MSIESKWLYHCTNIGNSEGKFLEVWIVASSWPKAIGKAVEMMGVEAHDGSDVSIKQIIGMDRVYEVG